MDGSPIGPFVAVVLPAFLIALAAGYVATRVIRDRLLARQIVDRPNERSSHDRPVPRGAGLALVPLVLVLWAALPFTGLDKFGPSHDAAWPLIVGALGLMALSWRDDLKSLPAAARLVAHLAAAILGILALPSETRVFQGLLPLPFDRAAAVLAWVWFVNLYNFMDGIDGITGVETEGIALGLVAVFFAAQLGARIDLMLLAGVVAGFMILNWHPAKIFLGDSGSVPLGYLLGWMLIATAARGLWAPALILPAYYLADATITLVARATSGEKVWQAHKRHFYQIALRGGASHAAVARRVALANLALIVLAVVAIDHPLPALAAAAIVVAILLALLARMGRTP